MCDAFPIFVSVQIVFLIYEFADLPLARECVIHCLVKRSDVGASSLHKFFLAILCI